MLDYDALLLEIVNFALMPSAWILPALHIIGFLDVCNRVVIDLQIQ